MDSEWIRSKQDEAAWDQGCRPDPAAADRVRTFFARFLRHSKGSFAGQPFELLEWQWRDVVRPLFGWKRRDGSRRYRTGFIEVPKKNGKSTLCSGLALYLLIGDGEPGAEVYSAAASQEQAAIVFREAAAMVKASPELASYVEPIDSKKRLNFEMRDAWFQALSADAHTKEGLNIHGLIFDEVHAQKDGRLWKALRYGGAARKQPLIIEITTAGAELESLWGEHHQYAEKVIKGEVINTSHLAVIYAAAEDADVSSEAVWRAANPSYGETIQPEEMREAYEECKHSAVDLAWFKRYRLNIRTSAAASWLSAELWNACNAEPIEEGPCFGALDLAYTTDLAACALYWPETHSLRMRYWVPEEACKEREKRNRQRFDKWIEAGLITQTPGAVIDQELIRDDILELHRQVDGFKAVGIDPWNAVWLATKLMSDRVPIKQFRQGFASMSPAMKHMEALIKQRLIKHGGHPVLAWNFRNLAAEKDAAGNIKPSRKASLEKIDGMVAALMTVGLSIAEPDVPASIYEQRGLERL